MPDFSLTSARPEFHYRGIYFRVDFLLSNCVLFRESILDSQNSERLLTWIDPLINAPVCYRECNFKGSSVALNSSSIFQQVSRGWKQNFQKETTSFVMIEFHPGSLQVKHTTNVKGGNLRCSSEYSWTWLLKLFPPCKKIIWVLNTFLHKPRAKMIHQNCHPWRKCNSCNQEQFKVSDG